ncbi:unnamed protein product [Linum tenue]|uniref:Uncharacterized protein n=2 Tax=Linum tenue TaxID=586396 RepID=A0AAV0QHN0_9ROSI|nr:unnamed protein product [Linum tenue]
MLHRSFKPAKCKTALKMASSRIKLLRNKREVQLRQLKREVAQLLAAGNYRTARIRVEHVVREEKTVAAYDLIEIYCELIVARLSMIESQKLCPVDLKEAVSSVVFASPRCADLPELADVKKHFKAKYGKEFVSAAVELHPNCGVSRLLVEKLSAKAPDGPEKMKILSAIAEEQNVKWDPKLFEDVVKPHEDLLNGPATFQPASTVHAQTHNVDPPQNFNRSQVSSHGKHDTSTTSYAPNYQTSSHLQSPRADDFGSSEAMPSVFVNPEQGTPPGTGPEVVEYRHSYARSGEMFSSGSHQHWNTEFKDATAAAQAAAESAERASMAARAAAELSIRDNLNRRQSRDESHLASGFSHREDERQHHTTGSRLQGQRSSKDPVKNTSKINSRVNHEQQTDDTEEDVLAALNERFYNLKGRLAATSDSDDPPEVVSSPSLSNRQPVERHSRTSSSESEKSDVSSDRNMRRAPSEHEGDSIGSNMNGGENPESFDYFDESRVEHQSSVLRTHPHTEIPSFDDNSTSTWDFHKSSEDATSEDLFVIGQARSRVNAQESSSDVATAVFDDYGSDDDEAYNLHVEDELNAQRSNMASHFSSRTNAWSSGQKSLSPRKSSSSSLFATERNPSFVASEGLTNSLVPSKQDDLLPVTFDDSDGPSSENEEDGSISSQVHSRNLGDHHLNDSSSLMASSSPAENENLGYNNRQTSLRPSSANSIEGQMHHQNIQGVGADVIKADDGQFDHPNRSSISSAQSRSNSSDVNEKFQTPGLPPAGDNDSDDESGSGSEGGKELNFGFLAGGLRNKGYKHPPYLKNPAIQNPSPSKQAVEEDTSTRNIQDTSSQVPHQEASRRRTSSRTQAISYNFSDGDSVKDPPLQQKFNSTEEGRHSNHNSGGVEVNKVSGSRRTFFDSDDSDAEMELSKQKSAAGKSVAGQAFSRRTKAAAASDNRSSHPKNKISSQSSGNVDYVAPTRQSPPTSNSKPSTFRSSSESPVSSGKNSVRPSVTKQTSNPAAPKTVPPGNKESSAKASGSAVDPPSREDSINRASHVHPKLPDYDTFAAHLLSLRQDRQ